MQCVLSAEHNHRLWKTLHMNENQSHSYLRSSAASGSGLKQCRELILMISGQHPCNNYTSHIRPLFARVPPLNLFACKMRDLNKRSSFINDVIYIYDQCACIMWACHQRVQDQGFHVVGVWVDRGVPLQSDKITLWLVGEGIIVATSSSTNTNFRPGWITQIAQKTGLGGLKKLPLKHVFCTITSYLSQI